MKKNIISEYIETSNIANFTNTEKKLFEKAKLAAQHAYAPYSNFRVGVAVLLEDGKMFSGNNQENASYPLGVCAEQTTIAFVHANFPRLKMIALVITALKQKQFVPISPCGKCRQVILEIEEKFNHPIKIILYGNRKQLVFNSVKLLLPLSFSIKDLLK